MKTAATFGATLVLQQPHVSKQPLPDSQRFCLDSHIFLLLIFHTWGSQNVILGPCIIPDEPVGKETVEKVAVIKDPNGYTFEVTEEASRRDPVSKVTLNVLDMEKAIDFYQDVRFEIWPFRVLIFFVIGC